MDTTVQKILQIDAGITKSLVAYLLQFGSFKTLKTHSKFLEISCNGIFWFAIWMAFIWIFESKYRYQMQVNMLIGLLLDVVIIALLKATFRRRRPVLCNDMLTLGPDKFSFPSGHASRSFLILLFFTNLYPVFVFWWPPIIAWACSVCLSRIITQRHYLLDVIVGIVIGVFEALILSFIWVGPEAALYFINFISNDNLPGGTE